ncbi:hypothetical protein [Jannaschia sp. R86511]|uniref:hypothetical protein n=1 Tax=Jannaschia sp. R86511 TaxID=3093853 RepID=UPI0036D3D46F
MLLFSVAGFQVAVAAGAPWGRWTQGGTAPGVLPQPQRVAAVASAGLLVTWGGALLGRVGEGPMRDAHPRLVAGLSYSAAAYAVLGTVVNALSRSPHERALWTPVSAVIAGLSIVTVRGSRRGGSAEAPTR